MFENAKIGDRVILSSRWNGDSVSSIQNITKGGSFRVGGRLFDKSGRLKSSDPWISEYIKIATDEDIEKIRKDNFIKDVFKMIKDIKTLDYEKAIKIAMILGESEVPNAKP